MPKTKSKTSSRKSTLLDKLRKLDGKGKFFLFIVVFAVMGGVYFTYKSFAATNGQTAFADQIYNTGGSSKAVKVTERTGSKKNLTVWELSLPGPNMHSSVFASFKTSQARNYKGCALVKLPRGGGVTLEVNPTGAGRVGPQEFFPIAAGNQDYFRLCTRGTAYGANIDVKVYLIQGSDLRVSAINIE